MDTATFEVLLHKVAPLITKQDTHLRKSIPPAERLSLTLRHLATGKCFFIVCFIYVICLIITHANRMINDNNVFFLCVGETQESLSMSFRMGQSTVSKIIREVCQALIIGLKKEFLKFPSSELEWKAVAQDFGDKWNFFNCIGAIDGKTCKN